MPAVWGIQESILHALKDCPQAKRIWEALQLFHLFDPAISDVTIWVQTNSMADYGVTFILTCWFIWRSRNEQVFNDTCWPTWLIINKIKSELDIILLTFGSHPCWNNPHEVVWLPPADGSIKVNVDGSSFGNPGQAGYGGLVRNNLGEWICGFYGSCGVADNLIAEIYAIMHGLDLAWNRGYRDVILGTDSKSAIDLLNTAQAY